MGQYASMHGKGPVEKRIQQVVETMDDQDLVELERVASDKIVRCIRNQRQDLTPPPRPPKRAINHPSAMASPPRHSSSGCLYEPTQDLDQGQEDEPEGELEVSSGDQDDI